MLAGLFLPKHIDVKPFHFKAFTIFENTYSHRIGTDAMLLGALVDVERKNFALDVGSGSGVLSLMMAQKKNSLKVHALEIDAKAHNEGITNVSKSPFAHQIECIHQSILSFTNEVVYDLIITNPPYYLSNNPSTQDNEREKHTSIEALKGWFHVIFNKLDSNGNFWIVFPSIETETYHRLLFKTGFHKVSQYEILGKNNVPVRTIGNYSPAQTAKPHIEQLKIRDENGAYTQKYREITQNFHGTLI